MKKLFFLVLLFLSPSAWADRWLVYTATANINCASGVLTISGADIYCSSVAANFVSPGNLAVGVVASSFTPVGPVTFPFGTTFSTTTFTGPITAPNGSVGAPSITVGDPLSGLYRTFLNHIGIALNGSNVIDFQTADINFTPRLDAVDGSPSSCPYTFASGSQNNGMYKPGVNQLGFATGGVNALTFNSAQNGIFNGNISFNAPTQGVVGVVTSALAAPGNLGENFSSATFSATNLPATTQYGDLVSTQVTAGAWLVTFMACEQANGATLTSGAFVGISTTSGSGTNAAIFNLVEATNQMQMGLAATTGDSCQTVANFQMNFNGSTTIYGKMEDVYAAGQPRMVGKISAVRPY